MLIYNFMGHNWKIYINYKEQNKILGIVAPTCSCDKTRYDVWHNLNPDY